MSEFEIERDYEWKSVREIAKRDGLTQQQVYNRIKRGGYYETMSFNRGTMSGHLIKVYKDKNNHGE